MINVLLEHMFLIYVVFNSNQLKEKKKQIKKNVVQIDCTYLYNHL